MEHIGKVIDSIVQPSNLERHILVLLLQRVLRSRQCHFRLTLQPWEQIAASEGTAEGCTFRPSRFRRGDFVEGANNKGG